MFLNKKLLLPKMRLPQHLPERFLALPLFLGFMLVGISSLHAQFPQYPDLEQAATDFYLEKFDQAAESFKQSLTADTTQLGSQDQILAYQFLTFSYYALRAAEAEKLIRQILELDINAAVDTTLFEQKYSSWFDYERAQLVGQVRLLSNPLDANVYINNKYVGTTPIDTLMLAASTMFIWKRKITSPKDLPLLFVAMIKIPCGLIWTASGLS